MATENQVPASQTTQTLGISTVSLQAGSEGGEVVTTRYSFQLESNGEIVDLIIGNDTGIQIPTTGQIYPRGF